MHQGLGVVDDELARLDALTQPGHEVRPGGLRAILGRREAHLRRGHGRRGRLGLGNRGTRDLRCRGWSGVAQQVEQKSEEHTSELQSLMRISYAVLCLKKNNNTK